MQLPNQELKEKITLEISNNNGSISFARFMEMALYSKDFGYYSAANPKFGHKGDFITAPEISPLFSKVIAKQFVEINANINDSSILELGAGTGRFAKDILLELEKLKSIPGNYYIFEISPDLKARQKALLQKECKSYFDKIIWLDSLDGFEIKGLVFANEVLDAMPVHCFASDGVNLKERTVSYLNNQFSWQLKDPVSDELSEKLNMLNSEFNFSKDYESEINLSMDDCIKDISKILRKGLVLFFDYGYGRKEYYHPDRSMGTLMCFKDHQKNANPFENIGLQDITAHVDFTSVIETAFDNGLTLAGFTTQAAFLGSHGILEIFERTEYSSNAEKVQAAQNLKKLILPNEMGEIVKVMGLNKGYDFPVSGFSLQDKQFEL